MPEFGMNEDKLRERATVFHGELLRGRRILVTGAGRGLGKAIAALCGRRCRDLRTQCGTAGGFGGVPARVRRRRVLVRRFDPRSACSF